MVHLNELVKVNREHFKGDNQMLPKDELVPPSDDVLFVIWIFII